MHLVAWTCDLCSPSLPPGMVWQGEEETVAWNYDTVGCEYPTASNQHPVIAVNQHLAKCGGQKAGILQV